MSMNHQTGAPASRSKEFITLTSPDKKLRATILTRRWGNQVRLRFYFSLQGRMSLVDAIDALPYVSVLRAADIDTDRSLLLLELTDGECFGLSRLADDLRELLFSNPS